MHDGMVQKRYVKKREKVPEKGSKFRIIIINLATQPVHCNHFPQSDHISD
jgi:hypothetical protein